MGIYVGLDSPSIIRYLEPLTGDLFTARFADCHFDETNFPSLGKREASSEEKRELSWKVPSLIHLDPYTSQCENEVRRIIHLQAIANQLPDAFTDATRVTKSYIPAINVPARVIVPEKQSKQMIAKESSITRQKRGRPFGSKDIVPRKRKINKSTFSKLTPEELNVPEGTQVTKVTKSPMEEGISEKIQECRNEEISINYTRELWNREETIIDDVFSYTVATEIINDDYEPHNLDDCRQRSDWPKWKEAIQTELTSLAKREVFGSIIQTPENVKPVGYKWVFIRKRNEKNEVVRYKARLVAQGFSQRPGIDFDETYSPVMDTITFRFLISITVLERLEIRLMDIVTAYLYGSLD